jgi:hypothetical protein
MLLQCVGFIGLTFLPANFSYPVFAVLIFVLGCGSGLFTSPNTSSIMSSVPPETRGVSSGMRATFQNGATLVSIGLFFSIVTLGLAAALPSTLYAGLTKYGVPSATASGIAHLPPTAALFGAFLGYNPIGELLPPQILQHISAADKAALLGKTYFPNLISGPFMDGLHAVFYISAFLCLVAAGTSLLRGKQVVYGSASSGEVSRDGAPVTARPRTLPADEEVELVDGEVLTENGEYDGLVNGRQSGHAAQHGHAGSSGEAAARASDAPGSSGSRNS